MMVVVSVLGQLMPSLIERFEEVPELCILFPKI
jgi:hypothetical protein